MSSYKPGDLAKHFAKQKKTMSDNQTEGGKRLAELLTKGAQKKNLPQTGNAKTSPGKVNEKQKSFFGSKKRKKGFTAEEDDGRESKKFKGTKMEFTTPKEQKGDSIPVPFLSKKKMKKFQKASKIEMPGFKKIGNHEKSNQLMNQSNASSSSETNLSFNKKKWKKNKKKPFNQNMTKEFHNKNAEEAAGSNKAMKDNAIPDVSGKKKRNRKKKFQTDPSQRSEVKETNIESSTLGAGSPLAGKKKKNKKRNKNLNDGTEGNSIWYDSKKADTIEDVDSAIKPEKSSKKHKKRKQIEGLSSGAVQERKPKSNKHDLLENLTALDTSPSKKKKKRKKNKQETVAEDDDEQEIISQVKDILSGSGSPLASQKHNKKAKQSPISGQQPSKIVAEDEIDVADQLCAKNKKNAKKMEKFSKEEQKKGLKPLVSFATKKKYRKSDIPGLTNEPKLMKFSSRAEESHDTVDGDVADGSAEEEDDEPADGMLSKSSLTKSFVRSNEAEKNERTLFFGNIPLGMDKDDVKKIFKNYGAVESVRFRNIIPLKDKTPRKFAERRKECNENVTSLRGYVVFKTKEDAESGMKLNGTVVNGNHIRVDWANSHSQKMNKGSQQKTVFIGNLPFNVRDESVWSKFSDCGDIVYARVIRDSDTGNSRGFGFVQFKDASSVSKALDLNETELDGREIRVKVFSDKPDENVRKSGFKQERPDHKKRFKPRFNKKNPMGISENSRKSMKKILHKKKQDREKKRVASVFKPFYDSLSTASKLKTAKRSL